MENSNFIKGEIHLEMVGFPKNGGFSPTTIVVFLLKLILLGCVLGGGSTIAPSAPIAPTAWPRCRARGYRRRDPRGAARRRRRPWRSDAPGWRWQGEGFLETMGNPMGISVELGNPVVYKGTWVPTLSTNAIIVLPGVCQGILYTSLEQGKVK